MTFLILCAKINLLQLKGIALMNITKFIVGLAVACTITACGQVNEILPEVNMDFPAIIIKQELPREMVLVNPWNPVPEDYEADLIHVTNGYYVDKQCYDALNEMLDACREAGNRPLICSAYRSYNTQTWLYNRKVNQFIGYGYSRQTAEVRAAEIVAVPGTSEHQLGLAVDIVDSRNQNLNSSQENTDTQKWLM